MYQQEPSTIQCIVLTMIKTIVWLKKWKLCTIDISISISILYTLISNRAELDCSDGKWKKVNQYIGVRKLEFFQGNCPAQKCKSTFYLIRLYYTTCVSSKNVRHVMICILYKIIIFASLRIINQWRHSHGRD